jgi:GTP-binding protein LepA
MLPGFKPVQPVVFCGLFPVDAADFEVLRAAMGKLRLNDASFSYEMETSAALGFGFRCGFLGLLHLEIIQERLEREFNLNLISTAPSWSTPASCATARARTAQPGRHAGRDEDRDHRGALDQGHDLHARRISRLGAEALPGPPRRQTDLSYVGSRAKVVYDLPLNEVVFDFYDRLKSISKGYASFDYASPTTRGRPRRMSILVNAEPVDALSMLVHRSRADAAAAPCARS